MGKKKKGQGSGAKNKPAKGRDKAQASFSASTKRSRDVGDGLAPAVRLKGGQIRSSPVPGLSNLGNTCFFNAVLQNISQSHYFRAKLSSFISSPAFDLELNLANAEKSLMLTVNSAPGSLATTLSEFLSRMHSGGGATLNPRPVLSEISKKAPRFAGYKQQDSQELLRYLLDSLRNEEIDRIKRAILNTFGMGKMSGKQLTDDQKGDIRAYGMKAQVARTFVDDVFGGTLVSTVQCADCANCTIMQESFLDLSLPVAADKSGIQSGSEVYHSGGYQTRSKKNEKREEGGNPGSWQIPEEEPAYYTPKLSKHQKKKLERESKKAAKRSSRGVKSNQTENEGNKILSGPDAASSPPESEMEIGDRTSALVPGTAEVDSRVDPATGEPACCSPPLSEGGPSTDPAHAPCQSAAADSNQQDLVSTGANLSADSESNLVASLVSQHNLASTTFTLTANSESNLAAARLSADPESNLAASLPTADSESNLGADSESNLGVDSESNLGASLVPTTDQQASDTSVGDHCNPTEAPLDAAVTSSYASSGPQNDSETTPEGGGGGGGGTLSAQGSLDGVVEEVKGLCLDANANITNSDDNVTNSDGNVTNSDGNVTNIDGGEVLQPVPQSTGALTATEEPRESQEAYSEDLVSCKKDSLLFSLEKFCAPEYLTGDNRFACADCTKDLFQKRAASTKQESSPTRRGVVSTRRDVVSPATSLKEETSPSGEDGCVVSPVAEGSCRGKGEGQYGGEDGCVVSPVETEGEGQFSVEDGSRNVGDGEEEQSLEYEDAGNMSEPEIAFCDATKQLLIQRPPRVLTLHLKRFTHHGKSLKKNNRHISFPPLLDMMPFCTEECKDPSSSSGSFMYSLYGIVEHSGGMQNGHYVAYVRNRTVPATPTTTKTVTQATPTTKPEVTVTQAMPTTSGQEATVIQATPTTSGQEATVMQATPTTTSGQEATVMQATPTTSGQEASPNPDEEEKQFQDESASRKRFERICTTGQWYYASDGHVRAASESEVMKSQAYLLFYEQLPLDH